MYGGIYRVSPQPIQGRRFVPIPAQGDQPPRRNAALAMAVVLACWPTGIEHQQRRPSAATITQAVTPFAPVALRALLRQSWEPPTDYVQRRELLAQPFVLVPADNPPPRSLSLQLSIIRGMWEPGQHVAFVYRGILAASSTVTLTARRLFKLIGPNSHPYTLTGPDPMPHVLIGPKSEPHRITIDG